jgi:hypothetical protein
MIMLHVMRPNGMDIGMTDWLSKFEALKDSEDLKKFLIEINIGIDMQADYVNHSKYIHQKHVKELDAMCSLRNLAIQKNKEMK